MSATESMINDALKGKLFYSGNPQKREPGRWKSLPFSQLDKLNDPTGYRPDKGLVDAVNVALTLGQPLLLTGEPGTGKTQLAYSIAYELGFEAPLKFETKSGTEGRDLFYTFDTLGRFHAASHEGNEINPVNFITYNALGKAILYANNPDEVGDVLPPELGNHMEKQRSVVLIDEVDKAPREVPNDILNEIEAMYFRIPELGNRVVKADNEMRPIVIITSNSEKALPDAFLRRCIYYHIPFPDRELMQQILVERIGKQLTDNNAMLDDVLSLFQWLRQEGSGLRKKPGTAELLNWAQFLSNQTFDTNTSLKNDTALQATCYHTLFKTQDDLKLAPQLVAAWAKA